MSEQQQEHRAAPTGAILIANDAAPTGDLLWASLRGRPLLAWTVDAFAADAFAQRTHIGHVALVVTPERLAEAQSLLAANRWQRLTVVAAEAGQRVTALRAGLAALGASCAVVIVHAGARPLAPQTMLAAGMALAQHHPDAVAVATEPVIETLKHVQGERVIGTLPRERLARAQTPYIFHRAALERALALEQADGAPNDELALARAAGLPLIAYPGSSENLLATSAADLPILAALLDGRIANRLDAPDAPDAPNATQPRRISN